MVFYFDLGPQILMGPGMMAPGTDTAPIPHVMTGPQPKAPEMIGLGTSTAPDMTGRDGMV